MTATDLRTKRAAAGISGHAVCQLTGISRAKLSDVERGTLSRLPKIFIASTVLLSRSFAQKSILPLLPLRRVSP